MTDPHEPVPVSVSEKYPRTNTPTDGEAVGYKYGEGGMGSSRVVIEDSRNWYAWLDALDAESYVSLTEMR